MSIALFIGRFQPFHEGHLWAIKHILEESDKIIIGIGSSQYENLPTNPFHAEVRKDMIKQTLDAGGIKNYALFLIPDIHHDNDWVDHVGKLLPKFDVVYTGSPLSKKLFVEKGHIVKSLPRHKNISASEIRLRMQKDLDWQGMVPNKVLEILVQIGALDKIKKLSA